MENRANAPLSEIFSRVYKTFLNFFLIFQCCLKSCHDLKIAYGVKGYIA